MGWGTEPKAHLWKLHSGWKGCMSRHRQAELEQGQALKVGSDIASICVNISVMYSGQRYLPGTSSLSSQGPVDTFELGLS